jgi:hypothetical protein
MRWLKKKIASWLLKGVEVEELAVKKLRVGENTVTVDADSITLPGLTANPTLAAGKVWFRSDQGLLAYSPDGSAVRNIPYGTINVDAHASRHQAGGADEINLAFMAAVAENPKIRLVDLATGGVERRISSTGGHLKVLDVSDAVVMDLEAHASRHAAGGADPIPSGGIAIGQLQSPTLPFSLSYAMLKNLAKPITWHADHKGFITTFSLADVKMQTVGYDGARHQVRMDEVNKNGYTYEVKSGNTTADELIVKWSAGTATALGNSARDITSGNFFTHEPQASGSALAFYVDGTAVVSVTDTAYASGAWGVGVSASATCARCVSDALLVSPTSQIPPALGILELPVAGSGTESDPYRPSLSQDLVEVEKLSNLPIFLYVEADKYRSLRARGFTDEDMARWLGYVPQHQVDLNSVRWGSFELHADKAPTAIVVITGDNPYKPGAIDRQKAVAKRAFAPPTDYSEAVSLYNALKKDYPHWLAGKDNFAYQTLGHEIFDWLQNIDFYYGELLEHKTHYSQLKQVPDFEIRNRLNELIERLSKVSVLVEERDKHIAKAKEVLKRGW